MKFILEAQVLNPYRSHRPLGFYNLIKGHSGTDILYHFEELPSPVSGKVANVTKQVEMGNCIYIEDTELGNIHVFAHMDSIHVKTGDHVTRGQILGITGNSGSKTTAAHLHYEVITFRKNAASPYNALFSPVMTRSLNGYIGWNVDPIKYIRMLYTKYKLDKEGNAPVVPLPPERPLVHK